MSLVFFSLFACKNIRTKTYNIYMCTLHHDFKPFTTYYARGKKVARLEQLS